jgi:hypothetical protein
VNLETWLVDRTPLETWWCCATGRYLCTPYFVPITPRGVVDMGVLKQRLIGYRTVVFLGEDFGGEGVRQAEIPATLGRGIPCHNLQSQSMLSFSDEKCSTGGTKDRDCSKTRQTFACTASPQEVLYTYVYMNCTAPQP